MASPGHHLRSWEAWETAGSLRALPKTGVVWLMLAPAGACAYLAGFAMPVTWPGGLDLPLALLACCTAVTAMRGATQRLETRTSLFLPVVAFLVATAVSIGASHDPGRSLQLSAALLPGALLYFVISSQIEGLRQLRWIYVMQSLVGLGIGLSVLHALWRRHWVVPHGYENWMTETGSPILVVTNDAAFLAILAPFSLALLLSVRGRAIKLLAATSLAATVLGVVLIQSRVAILALLISMTVVVAFLRRRWVVPCALTVIAAAALIDGLRGFPLLERFWQLTHSGSGLVWDARFPIWSAAWTAFLEHPWLGQGPHTFSYTSRDGIQVSWAHNLWLEIAAEQGIVGLLAFAWLMGAAAWTGIRALGRTAGARRALCAGAVAALFAFACAALFDFSFLRQWVAVCLLTLAGVTEAMGRPDGSEEEKTI